MFMDTLKNSAKELHSVKCIATTGLFIALFVILDVSSIRIGAGLKINIAFIAIAVIGMLYGPIPAALAAFGGDIVGCILAGDAPIVPLMLTAITGGLVYGFLLYKKENTKKLVISCIISRLIDSFVLNLVVNTAILLQFGFLSRTAEAMYIRLGSIAVQFAIYSVIMAVFMPTIKTIYGRLNNKI